MASAQRPVSSSAGIVHAETELEQFTECSLAMAMGGCYDHPDLFSLEVNVEAQAHVIFEGGR